MYGYWLMFRNVKILFKVYFKKDVEKRDGHEPFKQKVKSKKNHYVSVKEKMSISANKEKPGFRFGVGHRPLTHLI